MPFVIFRRGSLAVHIGIICGSGSFTVQFGDHFRSRDHLRSGINCGAAAQVVPSFSNYASSRGGVNTMDLYFPPLLSLAMNIEDITKNISGRWHLRNCCEIFQLLLCLCYVYMTTVQCAFLLLAISNFKSPRYFGLY